MKNLQNKIYGAMALAMTSAPVMALAQQSASKNAYSKIIDTQNEASNIINWMLTAGMVIGIALVVVGAWMLYQKFSNPQSQTKGGAIVATFAAAAILIGAQYVAGDLGKVFEGDNKVQLPKFNG